MVLTVFRSANYLCARRSSQCLALCFFELLILNLLVLYKTLLGTLQKTMNSSHTFYRLVRDLYALKITVDLIANADNVSA